MTRPSAMKKGEWDQFERMLLSTDLSAEEAEGMTRHPMIFKEMLRHARTNTCLRLRHCRFHSLEEKVAQVKTWPGISDRFAEVDFRIAVEEARDSGRLGRFEAASPQSPLLDVVVSVHLGSDIETFLYGRDRLRDSLGEKFSPEWTQYEGRDLAERLALLKGIQAPRNRIAVDVIDLGAHFKPKEGFIPSEIRCANSAYVQVFYAGAQDPDWILQMNLNQGVPFALIGGYGLTLPGYAVNGHMFKLWFFPDDGRGRLDCDWSTARCHSSSLPTLWK